MSSHSLQLYIATDYYTWKESWNNNNNWLNHLLIQNIFHFLQKKGFFSDK